jgi:ABC-type antimicrobial peptide transport system permease subunit
MDLWHKEYVTNKGVKKMISQRHLIFWIVQITVGFLSTFFLVFGINVLFSAYRLNNPHEFIMYFFSSNFMILISAAGLLWPVMNIYRRFRRSDNSPVKKQGLS